VRSEEKAEDKRKRREHSTVSGAQERDSREMKRKKTTRKQTGREPDTKHTRGTASSAEDDTTEQQAQALPHRRLPILLSKLPFSQRPRSVGFSPLAPVAPAAATATSPPPPRKGRSPNWEPLASGEVVNSGCWAAAKELPGELEPKTGEARAAPGTAEEERLKGRKRAGLERVRA
jgi:hypothetical protein